MRFTPKRVLRWLGKGLAVLVGVVVLLVAVVLLGLQTPWAQNKVATIVSDQATQALKGRVEVTLEGAVTPFGLSRLSARLLPEVRDDDVQGDDKPLAELSNVRASWDLLALVRSLLGSGPLVVSIKRVEVERALVDLRAGPDGNLALVNATTVENQNESQPESTGPAPVVHVGGLTLKNVSVLLPVDSAAPTRAPRQQATIGELEATFDMHEAMSGTLTLSSLEAAIPNQEGVFRGDLGAVFYLSERGVPVAQAAVKGELEGLPVTVSAVYDDEHWAAHVEAEGSEHAWRATAFGFEPTEAVTLSVAALGDLETARAHAVLAAGSSNVSTLVDATYSPLSANAALVVNGVNPRTFAAAAPSGSVNLTAALHAQAEPESANLTLVLRDSTLEGKPIPDFDLDVHASGRTHADFQLRATDESGLELQGKVNDSTSGLTFSVQGQAKRLPDYAAAPELRALDVRDLALDAHGTWKGESETLDASLDLDVERVHVPSAQVQASALSVQVSTSGKLSAPALAGTVRARALKVGEVSVTALGVEAQNTGNGSSALSAKARVRLTKDAPLRDVSAGATITALSPLTVDEAHLSFASHEQALHASVAKLQVGAQTKAEGVVVSGIGEIAARFEQRANTLDVEAQVNALDLAALSQLLEPMAPPLRGSITANLGFQAMGERWPEAHLFARGEGVGTSDTRIDTFGASLVVKRDILSGVINLERGQSKVRVDTRDVDLTRLRRAAQSGFRAQDLRGYVVATALAHSRDFAELERAGGEIHADGLVQSQVIVEQRDDLPLSLTSAIKLNDVSLRKAEPPVPTDWLDGTQAAPEKKQQRSSAPASGPASSDATLAQTNSQWEITGLNAEWTSRYDGKDGSFVNTIAASGHGEPVQLAKISLTTTVPLSKLDEQFGAWLPNAPLDATLVVPNVPLEALPLGPFIPSGMQASISADLRVSGSVSAPNAQGSIAVNDFQVSANNNSFPVSLSVETKASKAELNASFELTHQDVPLASGEVDGNPEQNEWRAVMKIADLPLAKVPFVRDYGVDGSVSGDFNFDTSGGTPVVAAEIRADNVKAYGETIPTARVTAKLEHGQGELRADVRQSKGYAKLTAKATSPTKQLSDYRPNRAQLEVRSFEIRPFLVALQGVVSDLSGVLDGVVDVAFNTDSTDATGEIKLRDGLVLIPALGKQVHDAEMTIRIKPGRVAIQELSAKVERGEIQGDGQLEYTPDGRMVAELELRLPDDKRLPIANKGRDVAEASGRIKLAANSAPNQDTKLSVDVPVLDVYFSDSATDTVMSSQSPDFVSLGTYLPDGHFVTYKAARDAAKDEANNGAGAAPTKPLIVTVNLGKKVWLHHGTSTFAAINGKMKASISDDTRLTGTLNVAEGRIDIQGRVFDVQPGTVVFRGNVPPNPDVMAEAAWNAPSGHTIIAAYRGSVSNGKIILRSEPPLSYGEILNVLLFDDPEGAGGSDGSPGAGDVAATIASAGLSRSLTSLTDLDIQANIETDAAGSPRPELGVRLTPRLAVEVAYNLEPSAALSQPPDKAFVSFDWRLSNAWTIEATLGDHGSAATDLTWKYRY